MKSYKISQTIAKNLYPIEAKMDEIKDSNQKYFNQVLVTYSPVFLSAVLTAFFGDSLLKQAAFNVWYKEVISIVFCFVLFTAIIFALCKVLHAIGERKDKKGTSAKREKIAEEFYKVLVPELITGASLFEKAYEIECLNNGTFSQEETISRDAEGIVLLPLNEHQEVSKKAILYYYESFHQFRRVLNRLNKLGIREYADSKRDNLKSLYEIIGQEALTVSIDICLHCVNELSKRVQNSDQGNTLEEFRAYKRNFLT